MTGKTFTIALALLVGSTSIVLAQSQRNYGPNGPSRYGWYGGVFTGTVASMCPPDGPGYAPQWEQWEPRPQPGPRQWQGQPQWQPRQQWQRWD